MTSRNQARPVRALIGVSAAVIATVAGGLMVQQTRAQDSAKGPAATSTSTQPAGPVAVSLGAEAPKGAVVLLGGKGGKAAEGFQSAWYKRYSKDTPATWTVDRNGVAGPQQKSDISSRQEFGDCYLHAEFKTPTEGGGNAGVALQGRYEIQILNNYGKAPESHAAGALYSQKPAMVNASKKPGEWQSYDIIFRAPRFGPDGTTVTEKARATVFHNGVLVQNNEEFKGPTGIQYQEYKGEAKAGPVVLQGDHDVVQFRNVWVVPITTP
jgi:hypothetical protein